MNFLPYLCLAGTEIVNSNRTLSYLRRGMGGGRFSVAVTGPAQEAGYSDVYDDTYEADIGYATTLACYCAALDDGSNFQGPAADDAPWYSSAYFESEEFLGIVTDTLALSNSPVRSVTALSHGAAIGALQRRHRILSAHGIMYAASGRGMAWGERWLTEALSGSVCETCGGDEAEVVPACPDDPIFVGSAFRTLRKVGIVDGPVFTPIADVNGCLAQEVSFQLAAGIPYLHRPPTSAIVTISTGQRLTQLVETQEWGGDAAVSISIEALTDLTDVVVTATPVLDGADCPEDGANPCVRYDIAAIPNGHVLTIDAIERSVSEWNVSSKASEAGWRRLSFEGSFDWIEVPPCSTMCVAVTSGTGTASITITSVVREL